MTDDEKKALLDQYLPYQKDLDFIDSYCAAVNAATGSDVDPNSNVRTKNVSTLENVPHQQGGCLAPVQHLASHGVKALLAGGMGFRPLMAFHQVGIEVYYAGGMPTVGSAVQAFTDGKLPAFTEEFTCHGGAH